MAFAPDGRGWIGALNTAGTPTKFWVSQKLVGDQLAQPASVVTFDSEVDKGVLLAVAPGPGLLEQPAILFTSRPLGPPVLPLRLRRVVSPNDLAPLPVGAENGGNEGGPNSALLVRHSPTFPSIVGRWVVAHHGPGQGKRFARATYSQDGINWFNSENPENATRPPPQTGTETIDGIDPDSGIYPPVGGPFVLNTPSLAADPNDERIQYMAFLGTVTGESNIDLFIARSDDGGADFSGVPLGSRVLHLREVADLGDPEGSIQFLPAVFVDASGSVNVAYYVAWKESQNAPYKFKVRLVSIAQFSTSPHPSMWTRDLTTEFNMVDAQVAQTRNGRYFFGDYIMADARDYQL